MVRTKWPEEQQFVPSTYEDVTTFFYSKKNGMYLLHLYNFLYHTAKATKSNVLAIKTAVLCKKIQWEEQRTKKYLSLLEGYGLIRVVDEKIHIQYITCTGTWTRNDKEQQQFLHKGKYYSLDELIIIPKSISDKLLEQPDPSMLIALYWFYYYTSKWQGNTQVRATTSYVSKGLKLHERTVQKYKKILKELGLVEDKTHKSSDGKINGHYVYVKNVWTSWKCMLTTGDEENEEPENSKNITQKNHRWPKPTMENHPHKKAIDGLYPHKYPKLIVEIPKTNNDKNLPPNPQKKSNKIFEPYLPLTKKLSKIIQTQKTIIHTKTQLNSWANEFRRLEQTNGVSIQRMKVALDWYETAVGGEYIPVIESGKSFREKFIKLENAMERATKPKFEKQTEQTFGSRRFRGKADIKWKTPQIVKSWKAEQQ